MHVQKAPIPYTTIRIYALMAYHFLNPQLRRTLCAEEHCNGVNHLLGGVIVKGKAKIEKFSA